MSRKTRLINQLTLPPFVLHRHNSLSTSKTNWEKFHQISVLKIYMFGLNILQLPLKDRLIHHNQLGTGDFVYFTLQVRVGRGVLWGKFHHFRDSWKEWKLPELHKTSWNFMFDS